MRFGPVALAEAEGAILAHTVRLSAGALKKGTVLDAAAIARLRDDGIADVVAAVLEPGDVGEDAAAARLARRLASASVRADAAFTGRANLFAETAGVLVVDRDAVDRLNRIHPSVTLATLPAFEAVEAGRMVATAKIIPFAVPAEVMARAESVLDAAPGMLSVAPFAPMKVGVVSTLLPGLKPTIVDKTLRILEDRLASAGARIVAEERVPHEAAALAGALHRLSEAGAELLIVFGASAVVDRHDVIPEAIEAAGGGVEHFGMPVDPGNLLLLGRLDGKRVIGAPGCARSPKENGFDWVLHRTLAGLDVTADDIVGLGVGGLLMEIVSRPQPRAEPVVEREAADRPIAALVLAAGRRGWAARRCSRPSTASRWCAGRRRRRSPATPTASWSSPATGPQRWRASSTVSISPAWKIPPLPTACRPRCRRDLPRWTTTSRQPSCCLATCR